jgi:hypothetical protein
MPIQRVDGPEDAALAVDLVTNTAATGAAFNIDGGQHLIERRPRRRERTDMPLAVRNPRRWS